MQPTIDGSYALQVDPDSRGSIYLLALSALDDVPVDVAYVLSRATPHPPQTVFYSPGSSFCALDSYLGWDGGAAFIHPDWPHPITIAAVALVQLGPPAQVLAVARLDAPIVTPAPGWTAQLTLAHMSLPCIQPE